MTSKEDIIRMAREAQMPYYYRTGEVTNLEQLERFAALVAAAERNKLAAWMTQRGYATGHGDAIEDLLQELEWQVAEREREACAKVCEDLDAWNMDDPGSTAAEAIRERGDDAP